MDAHTDKNPHSNTDAHCHTNADTHCHDDPVADANHHADGNGLRNANVNCDAHADGNGLRNTNAYCDPYPVTHTHCLPHGDRHT